MTTLLSEPASPPKNLVTIAQKTAVTLSAMQTAFLAFSYSQGSIKNSFPVLERLFNAESTLRFTESGCWQAMMPFLASTYISLTVISLLVLLFRPGRELRMMVIGIASVHAVMAYIRLDLAPTDLYQPGAAAGASTVQFIMAGVLLITAVLPSANRSA